MVTVEPKYLIMVQPGDIGENHNKFYKMTPFPDGTFEAEWGAVGITGRTMRYNISAFEKKYNEKVRKGYVDRSSEHSVSTSLTIASSAKYADIKVSSIKMMIDNMLIWAKKVIKKNYTVSSNSISQEAVDEAQDIIDQLSRANKVYIFNNLLLTLFTVIPRRMVKVSDYLSKDTSEFDKIISREQSLLDTVSGQVVKVPCAAKAGKALNTDTKDTILDAYGIEIRECSADETALVKSRMDPDAQKKFVRCFHVINKETREKFDKYCKDEKVKKSEIKYYYHGSRNENYWNILIQGLKLHPNQRVQRAGTMFGYGLYFAPKATKSMGYTSLHGTYWAHGNSNNAMLMVYKVAMHKPFNLSQYSQSVSTWNEADCKKAGYGSVFAHAGISLRNDEAIVYNENACTISYLIETKD